MFPPGAGTLRPLVHLNDGGLRVENCMKTFCVTALILAQTLVLAAPGALANGVVPLTPGKPAGLHQAQLEDSNAIWIVAGAALVGIGVALAVSDDNSSPTATAPAATSTTTTTP